MMGSPEMSLTMFRRRIVIVVSALVLLAVPARAQLTSLLPPPPPPPAPLEPVLSKLDPLLQPAGWDFTLRLPVIVRAIDLASLPAVQLLVAQTGGILGRPLPIIEGVAADVPILALGTLTHSPLVRRVALDRLALGSLDRTAAAVGAPAVRQAFGYDGSGIGVAVIDSGITEWHDDLTDANNPGTQRVTAFVDFVKNRTTPSDPYGHGTHVAGIIAGNGYDSAGGRTGIAPAASLTVLKVLDSRGRGKISNVIAALGYVLEHRAQLNIRVVNLSIGAGVYESYETDCLTVAARRVVDAGVVVVASAGNGGRSSAGDRQYGAISSPGNAPWVLTVGAASHMGTVNRDDDTIADFSSRGPTAIDRIAKPDVVAPGVGTVSLSVPDSYLYRTRSWAGRRIRVTSRI
jgi:serine protease AprX